MVGSRHSLRGAPKLAGESMCRESVGFSGDQSCSSCPAVVSIGSISLSACAMLIIMTDRLCSIAIGNAAAASACIVGSCRARFSVLGIKGGQPISSSASSSGSAHAWVAT